MRITHLILAIACTTGCFGSSSAVPQQGLMPRPRMPTFDGQPLAHGRVFEGYVETALLSSEDHVARHQLGGSVRGRMGPSWDLGLTFGIAPSFGAPSTGRTQRPTDTAAAGVGGSIRKSAGSGAFRFGLAAGVMAWAAPVFDDDDERSEHVIKPTAYGSLVPSLRLGSAVAFLSFSLQAVMMTPDTHPAGHGVIVKTGAGFALGGGVRVDVAPRTWLSIGGAVVGSEEDGSISAAASIGQAID